MRGSKTACAAVLSAEHIYQANDDADYAYDDEDYSPHTQNPVKPAGEHQESQYQPAYSK